MAKKNLQHEDDPNAAAPTGSRGDAPEPIEVSEAAADLVKQLQAELDEAVEARKRALADFKNYQRRAMESEQQALKAGVMRLAKAVVPALDHFDLALAQNPQQMTVEHLLAAVKIVRDEFTKALASQGVERISPRQGEPFDPHRHEAVMRQAAEGVDANHVVMTLQPGYVLGDYVLRPAKVSVAPGEE
jgi:molecular chaperone GrpE